MTVCRSVSAITGSRRALPSPSRWARRRIWAADSSAETYRVRRPALEHVGQRHRGQGRLADPRRTADEDQRPGNDPATENIVELADPGGDPGLLGGVDVGERHRRDRHGPRRAQAGRAAAADARRGSRSGAGPPRPACSTPRSPGTGPPSAGSHGRTPSRRGWRRSEASWSAYAGPPTSRGAGRRLLLFCGNCEEVTSHAAGVDEETDRFRTVSSSTPKEGTRGTEPRRLGAGLEATGLPGPGRPGASDPAAHPRQPDRAPPARDTRPAHDRPRPDRAPRPAQHPARDRTAGPPAAHPAGPPAAHPPPHTRPADASPERSGAQEPARTSP